MSKGNKKALEAGTFDKDEAEFIRNEFCQRYGIEDKEVVDVFCEHSSWFVNWLTEEDEVRSFSVHATSGPESVSFEEL